MWVICVLGSAAAFMLQHSEGMSKAPLIWVHTLMALLLVFRFNVPGSQYKLDSHQPRLMSKLQSLQVHPDTMHFSTFEKANSVHCMFQVDLEFSRFKAGYHQPSLLLYVGSTAVGAQKDISIGCQSSDG